MHQWNGIERMKTASHEREGAASSSSAIAHQLHWTIQIKTITLIPQIHTHARADEANAHFATRNISIAVDWMKEKKNRNFDAAESCVLLWSPIESTCMGSSISRQHKPIRLISIANEWKLYVIICRRRRRHTSNSARPQQPACIIIRFGEKVN